MAVVSALVGSSATPFTQATYGSRDKPSSSMLFRLCSSEPVTHAIPGRTEPPNRERSATQPRLNPLLYVETECWAMRGPRRSFTSTPIRFSVETEQNLCSISSAPTLTHSLHRPFLKFWSLRIVVPDCEFSCNRSRFTFASFPSGEGHPEHLLYLASQLGIRVMPLNGREICIRILAWRSYALTSAGIRI